jgi:ElaB/YqjD/DUF883 family membrane-anchored ribosome-binding protein
MRHDYSKIDQIAEQLDHLIAELSVWNSPAPGASKVIREHDSNVGEALGQLKKACAALTMAVHDNEQEMAREAAELMREAI